MLIAGAALGLMQTAVAALRPDTPSAPADPKPAQRPAGHGAGRAAGQLSDAMQAMLHQATPAQAAPDLGRALRAYGG